MEGRSRIDLEAAQQCLTCRKAGLFTERHYKKAWSAGRVAGFSPGERDTVWSEGQSRCNK